MSCGGVRNLGTTVPADSQPPDMVFRLHAIQRMFQRSVTVDDVRTRPGSVGERLSAEADVRCAICKLGDVVPSTTTVTLERGATTVVVKAVPAGVCTNCGEKYVDEQTTRRLIDLADLAARTGGQVEVRQYAAA